MHSSTLDVQVNLVGVQDWTLQTITMVSSSISTAVSVVIIIITWILIHRDLRRKPTSQIRSHGRHHIQKTFSERTQSSPLTITQTPPMNPPNSGHRSAFKAKIQRFSKERLHARTTIPTRAIVIPLAIGDIMASSAKIAGQRTFGHPIACNIQATLIEFGNLVSLSLTILMCLLLFLSVTPTKRFWTIHQLMTNIKWVICGCYALALTVAIFPLIVQAITHDPIYGQHNLYCMFASWQSTWSIGLWISLLQFAFLVNIITYIYVFYQLLQAKRKIRVRQHAFQSFYWLTMRNIALYVLAFALTWFPGSGSRWYEIITHHSPPYAMSAFTAFLGPLRGLTNFVCYFLTSIRFVPVENGKRKRFVVSEPRQLSHVLAEIPVGITLQSISTKKHSHGQHTTMDEMTSNATFGGGFDPHAPLKILRHSTRPWWSLQAEHDNTFSTEQTIDSHVFWLEGSSIGESEECFTASEGSDSEKSDSHKSV